MAARTLRVLLAEMQMLQRWAANRSHCHLLQTNLCKKQLLPYLAPMVFTFASVLALMTLAFYNRALMEVLATALFYSANVYCVWVPIRDTAAMSILQGSRCDQLKMIALLLFIPASITLVFLSAIIANSAEFSSCHFGRTASLCALPMVSSAALRNLSWN